MKFGIVFVSVLLMGTTAFAQDASVADNAGAIVKMLVDSFKGGHWSIFASAVIMALVWLATKAPGLSGLVKGKAKVWTAAVCGMLSAFAITVATSGDWAAAIASGLSVGLGATGLFELVRRKIAHEAIDENKDGVLDPKGE